MAGMKLYRTSNGILVEENDNYYLVSVADWDELISSPHLFTRVREVIGKGVRSSFNAATVLAPVAGQEVWAAGVEICGITNWFSMYERGSPVLRQYQMGLLGDPVKDKAVYEASSPLTYLGQVKAPLLALAGANDIRVPPYEAEQVAAVLSKAGKAVDSKVYAGEGHGFFKREDQIDALERTVAWFDRYMGADSSASK